MTEQDRPEWVSKAALVAAGAVIAVFFNIVVDVLREIEDRQGAKEITGAVQEHRIEQLRGEIEALQRQVLQLRPPRSTTDRWEREGGRSITTFD